MFMTGYASFDWDMASPDLTNYSKQLLDRLIPADPYTPNVVRNLKDKPQPLRDDRHWARDEATLLEAWSLSYATG